MNMKWTMSSVLLLALSGLVLAVAVVIDLVTPGLHPLAEGPPIFGGIHLARRTV
jgi:hypothetical protein